MGIIGYKVFNPDWTCKGFKYKIGKTYKHNGNIEVCGAGFHFCQKISDCFKYYAFDSKNKVAKVDAIGLVETRGDKSVTDEIVILEELSWSRCLSWQMRAGAIMDCATLVIATLVIATLVIGI